MSNNVRNPDSPLPCHQDIEAAPPLEALKRIGVRMLDRVRIAALPDSDLRTSVQNISRLNGAIVFSDRLPRDELRDIEIFSSRLIEALETIREQSTSKLHPQRRGESADARIRHPRRHHLGKA